MWPRPQQRGRRDGEGAMVNPYADQKGGRVDRERMRADLEAARGEYHRVLAVVSDEHWARPSANPQWPIGGTLAHIALGLGTVPLRLRAARRGWRFLRMPHVVFHPLNTFVTRRLGRR